MKPTSWSMLFKTERNLHPVFLVQISWQIFICLRMGCVLSERFPRVRVYLKLISTSRQLKHRLIFPISLLNVCIYRYRATQDKLTFVKNRHNGDHKGTRGSRCFDDQVVRKVFGSKNDCHYCTPLLSPHLFLLRDNPPLDQTLRNLV